MFQGYDMMHGYTGKSNFPDTFTVIIIIVQFPLLGDPQGVKNQEKYQNEQKRSCFVPVCIDCFTGHTSVSYIHTRITVISFKTSHWWTAFFFMFFHFGVFLGVRLVRISIVFEFFFVFPHQAHHSLDTRRCRNIIWLFEPLAGYQVYYYYAVRRTGGGIVRRGIYSNFAPQQAEIKKGKSVPYEDVVV